MSRIGRSFDELLKEREQYINKNLLTKGTGFMATENDTIENYKDNKHLHSVLRYRMQHSDLSLLFFSYANLKKLHDLIRFKVWKKTDFKIGNQSILELLTIMRSIFFDYSRNGDGDLTKQIARLNEIVMEESVARLVTEVEQYKRYLVDKARPYQMVERPMNVSSAGTKSLNLESGIGL